MLQLHGILFVDRFLYGDLVRPIHNIITTASSAWTQESGRRLIDRQADQPTDRQTVISTALARLVIVPTSPSVDQDDVCGWRIDPVAELNPPFHPAATRIIIRAEKN